MKIPYDEIQPITEAYFKYVGSQGIPQTPSPILDFAAGYRAGKEENPPENQGQTDKERTMRAISFIEQRLGAICQELMDLDALFTEEYSYNNVLNELVYGEKDCEYPDIAYAAGSVDQTRQAMLYLIDQLK